MLFFGALLEKINTINCLNVNELHHLRNIVKITPRIITIDSDKSTGIFLIIPILQKSVSLHGVNLPFMYAILHNLYFSLIK